MSDTEELDPIDILAFTAEELQGHIANAKYDAEKAQVYQAFLDRWETDSSMNVLKQMKIEFEKDLDWFNVTEPLSMNGLKGKLVLLDFFTYCCINCMHILPELHALEELYTTEQGLVVIGVHSPKFENEKDAANILSAAQRYCITHPIVNDPHMTLWRSLGIRCWPSLILLSPKGAPILLLMGEGHGKFLEGFVDQALKHFQRKNEIQGFSLPLHPSIDLLPASNLRFPAKIARSESGRFALADAGNNRIVVFDIAGVVQHKIGGYEAGFIDGNTFNARFNSPQGVAFLNEDTLIVADTENHALRQITLSKNVVETLAGTGQQGNDRVGGKIGSSQAISSPWDVAIFRKHDMDMSFHLDDRDVPEKSIILISMAGTHQIWGYFPEGMIWWKFRTFDPCTCSSLVGNGLEENRNNSYPQNAAFAQPSGLALSKDFLFIADSESSSIRKVSMVDGKVLPVVGGDRNPLNLFAFGDVDGKQYNAKLQHPIGVTYNHVNDKVYVADTYNHKIKVIDTGANVVETLDIKAESNDPYQFNEPAGLCFDHSGRYVLVSDTNNHLIQQVDIETLKSKRFVLDFSKTASSSETDAPSNTGLQLIKCLPFANAKSFKLHIKIALHDGLKFTADAPQKWWIITTQTKFETSISSGQLTHGQLTLQLNRSNSTIATISKPEEIKLNLALNLCDAKTCLMKKLSLIVRDKKDAKDDQNNLDILEKPLTLRISQADIQLS